MLCVWAYANSHVRGFYLPDHPAWKEKLVLSQEEFGCSDDVAITARCQDGLSFLAAADGVSFASDSNAREILITDGKLETLICGRHSIGLVIREAAKDETRFTKYAVAPNSYISIGKAKECNIVINDQLASAQHAAIHTENNHAVWIDMSLNGSYINGVKIEHTERTLSFGDVIQIPTGLTLVWLDHAIAINNPHTLINVNLENVRLKAGKLHAATESNLAPAAAHIEFHRSPRLLTPPDTQPVEIESPIQKNTVSHPPWFMQIGPPMTMALPMVASVAVYSAAGMDSRTRMFSLVTVGCSSLLAIIWATVNRRYQKRQEKLTEDKRLKIYGDYLKELDELLSKRAQTECERLLSQYPSPSQVYDIISKRQTRLWERMPGHNDFLNIRVGVGDAAFPSEIKIPQNRLSLMDDELRDYPATIQNKYNILKNMPVVISLIDQAVFGLAGLESVQAMLQSIVAQLVSEHSYQDIRIVILHEPNQKNRWQWARWLPHCYDSSDRRLRLIASKHADTDAVLSHLSEVFSIREDPSREDRTPVTLPHYVVCTTDAKLIEDQPFLATLLSGAPGLTYIVAAPYMDQLPKECNVVFEADKNGCSLYEMIGKRMPLTGEFMDPRYMERLARTLAPMRVNETSTNTAIPTSVSFLETYGLRNVDDLDIWRLWCENHVYEGMRSVVGLGAGGKPFALDLSENAHGPHGLVAGTTGSGKSVMLQTYILSLAVSYSPEEVQFLLIDYKGGGMTAPFVKLPHVSGVLTNLDGSMIYRARVSLLAEVRRRQTLFAQSGVEKIDEYIRMRESSPDMTPLAHLIIITDEFAELKSDQPDFMSNLISIARVGRSLGIHLILATQKPANSVNDEIWANSRFKICLRVQDRADSMSMLKRPDAAYLKGAGRCYLQVGNDELFVQLQTSYGGANYNPDQARPDELVALLDDLGRPIPLSIQKTAARSARITEMDAVLSRIDTHARNHHVRKAFQLWTQSLPDTLFLKDIPAYSGSRFHNGHWRDNAELSPIVGMMDDLMGQRQIPVQLPFAQTGNYIVCGLPGSGKTTFLQTLALSIAETYTPAQAQVYIFSLTTRTLGILKSLPHMGDVVYQEEEAEIQRLVKMLDRENESRRTLFAQVGTDSFIEYNRIMTRRNEQPLPIWTIMIDRIQQVRDDTMFPEEARKRLFVLMREAAGHGICFVVTAMGMNELPGNLQTNFTGIALQQTDRGAYREVLGCIVQAEEAVIPQLPGRGLVRAEGPHEFQTALYGNTQGDEARAKQISAIAAEMNAVWSGARPAAVPRIPDSITQAEFLALPACANPHPWHLPLGYDISSGEPFTLSLDRDHSWLVFGARRSGKTGVLTQAARLFARFDSRIIGISSSGAVVSSIEGAEQYTFNDKRLDDALHAIAAEMNQRMQIKLKAREEGGENAVRAAIEQLQPILILIDDVDQLVSQGSEYANQFLSPTVSKASLYGIYVFGALAQDNYPNCSTKPLVRAFVETQRGLLLGGRYGIGYACPWNLPRSAQRTESFAPGQGLLYSQDTAAHIFIPLP
ncbi:type VII secretion protein EssC [Clostridia bacterium]|nr:type VII secretion protein EssC [Clostridia bacterium]